MKVLFFISAVIFTAYAGSFRVCVEDNVDYWGADLRNFRANSFAHCAQTCAREQSKGCRSFTYHKGNRHCWLKHTPFGARYTRNRSVLKSANLNCNKYSTLPSWPEDFKWSNAGTPRGYTCVKLWEPRGPATWNDNFMCWRNDRADPGLRWSFAGPIAGQRCTRILEGAEPARYTWRDNYLCVQPNSPYQFAWAYSNGLRDHWKRSGKACIQWYEPADPYTWKDNWLCSNRVAGKTVGPLPSWPGDFKWSSAGVPKGYYCDRIWEAACPPQYTWKDNFFCWRQNKADPGIRFNMNGAVSNARCTRILEPAELKYTWGDNYLCVPPTSPYHFSWAYSNAMRNNYKKAGNTCIQWIETADPNTWRDNHLCNKPVANPDPKRHWSVQNNARALKLRRMKVYRSYIVRYKRAAAIQRKRLRGYTLRYNKAHAAAVINARWTNKMVKLANANARAANAYHRRYTIYRRKFMAVRAGCIKAQRKWAGVANAQVKAQRVMIARMKVYRKKAALYKRRYLASLKLFRTRAKQRKAAYALYNKYIKTSNYWVRKYNIVARG